MKTIFFYILIIGNLATGFGTNLANGFAVQSASLKRFGLQGDFVTMGRSGEGYFNLGEQWFMRGAAINEAYKLSLNAYKNGFYGSTLEDYQPNYKETWEDWRETCSKNILE